MVVKVHKNKSRRRVKYDIKLDKKYKGKKLYQKILSNRMKSTFQSDGNKILKEIKLLIDAKKK